MSAQASPAPYPLRRRLALAGLLLAWALSALFLALGVRALETDAPQPPLGARARPGVLIAG